MIYSGVVVWWGWNVSIYLCNILSTVLYIVSFKGEDVWNVPDRIILRINFRLVGN